MPEDRITLTIASALWVNGTAYVEGQYVYVTALSMTDCYRCKAAHTAATATNKPGSGSGWTTYWEISYPTKTLSLARQDGVCQFKSYDLAVDDQRHDVPFFSQTDWSGGWGESDFQDNTRFGDGWAIDASTSGQISLGPYCNTALEHDGGGVGWVSYYGVHNGALYAAAVDAVPAYNILKWSGSHWDICVVATVVDLSGANTMASFNGYIFVPQGSGSGYLYSTDTSFTTSTLTDHHADGFCVASSGDGLTDILWKWGPSNNQIQSNTSGINGGAQWGTAAYIGESGSDINKVWVHQNMLLIGKTDGLYHYDSDGKVYRLLSFIPDSDNFRFCATLHGASYFNVGDRVAELTANNAFSYIDPYYDRPEGSKYGNCLGVTSDENHLYVCYTDSVVATTVSKVFKGTRVYDSQGAYRWAWTPIIAITYTGANDSLRIFPFAFGSKLWLSGYDNNFYYTNYYKPVSNSSSTYTTQGYLETGWIDLGHRDWYKLLDAVIAEVKMNSGDMSATKNVKLYYATDDSTSFTAIDTVISSATMGSKKYADTTPVPFKKVKFKIELNSDSSSVTPIVKYFAAYGSIRPTRIRQFDFSLLAEQGTSASPKMIRDFCCDMRDSTALVTLKDRFGTDHYIRILPGYPVEEELVNKDGSQVGIVMHVKAEKVDWS